MHARILLCCLWCFSVDGIVWKICYKPPAEAWETSEADLMVKPDDRLQNSCALLPFFFPSFFPCESWFCSLKPNFYLCSNCLRTTLRFWPVGFFSLSTYILCQKSKQSLPFYWEVAFGLSIWLCLKIHIQSCVFLSQSHQQYSGQKKFYFRGGATGEYRLLI